MFRKFKDFHLLSVLSVCIEFYSFHQPPPEERLEHSSAQMYKICDNKPHGLLCVTYTRVSLFAIFDVHMCVH